MKRLIVGLAAFVAMVGFGATGASAQTASARVHLIHGIPGTPVDVYVDGEVVFEDFQPGDTQDLSNLAGQTLVNVQVKPAGEDAVAIEGGDLDVPASGNYTVIAHLDASGTPKLTVFANDTAATPAGQGRLVVRHTAAAPAVDVLANGTAAFTNLTNPNEAKADLPAGTISASVVPTGKTEPVVIGPADLQVTDGASLIVYAVGSLEDETLTVVTETIDGLGTPPAAVNTGNSPVENDATTWPLFATLAVLGGFAMLAVTVGTRRLARVRAR
jgi:hypothetical protein